MGDTTGSGLDGRPRAREFCATSPGDVMRLDGQNYLVEGIGYHALTQAEADAVLQLDCLDTWRCYNWLVTHHLLSVKTPSRPPSPNSSANSST